MDRLYHCCTADEAAQIHRGGFDAPKNEDKMFWIRPEFLGQGKEDRVSFGLAGFWMGPWIVMKMIGEILQNKAPDLVVLECEAPKEGRKAFLSAASVGGVFIPPVTMEVTVPRENVSVIRTISVGECLKMVPGHCVREGARGTWEMTKATWKHRREAGMGRRIPMLLVQQASLAISPEWYRNKTRGLMRVSQWFMERDLKKIKDPSAEFLDGWRYVQEAYRFQDEMRPDEVLETLYDFLVRLDPKAAALFREERGMQNRMEDSDG